MVVVTADLPQVRFEQQRRRDLLVVLQIVRLQIVHQTRIRPQSSVQKEHVSRRVPIEQKHLQLLPHHAMVSLLRLSHRLLVQLLRPRRRERVPIESVVETAVRRGFLRFSGSGGIGNDVIGARDAQTCDALRGVEMGASAEIDEVSALVDLSGNREGKRLEWEQTISK